MSLTCVRKGRVLMMRGIRRRVRWHIFCGVFLLAVGTLTLELGLRGRPSRFVRSRDV